MDYKSFYKGVKSDLEEFLKEYFGVGSFSDPENVAFYDGEKVYNVVGEVPENEARELLGDDLGVYTFDTLIVRVNDELEETLVHELLHHVGGKVDKLKVLSKNEYFTQLLTNAYIKWKYPNYMKEDSQEGDTIKIYTNDYGFADFDARDKSADEIISLFRSKLAEEDDKYIVVITVNLTR